MNGRASTLTFLWLALCASACARTDVLIAPHAAPFETSSGLVQHSKWSSSFLSIGVVASNDGHSDVIWEVRKAGEELWACIGNPAPTASCQRATFMDEPTTPRTRIRLEAPPIARDALAVMPDEQPVGANLDELELRPVAVPKHGVWVTAPRAGLFSFGTSLYHCVLDAGRPACRPAQMEGGASAFSFGALSRHIVRAGENVRDVLWLVSFGAVMRCTSEAEAVRCVPVVLQSG